MDSNTEYNIHSVCRICLEYLNDSKHDLFLTPDLAKKLVVCTSLTVEPQDGFPKNICGFCYGRLNDLHDFHKQCIDSVQRFQELIKTNIFSSADKFKEFDFFKCVARVQDPDANKGDTNFDPLLNSKLEVNDEEDVFKLLENVENDHNEEEVPGKNEDIKVAVENNDDFKFSSSSSSESDDYNDEDFFPTERDEEESRKETVKTDLVMKPKRRRIPKSERKPHVVLECNICQKKFHKQHRYNAHMKYHNDSLPHQCEKCHKGFSTANGLRLHMEHAHSQTTETHPCPEEGCGKVFSRARILNWHLKKVHNKKKELNEPQCFMCGQCDKIFRCPMALKKHRYKHDGKELPFPCNICEKRFVTNSALKDHLMRHAGIKNFVCPYCGVGKTTKQEMQIHINFHTKEKTYPCHLCPHVCMNPQNLKTHIKIVHDKIKNYACQYCGKTFGKAGACRYHEMTHTGEKTCECRVCGKTFIHAKGLAKHLKTHEKRVMRAIEVRRKRNLESGEIPGESDQQQQQQLQQNQQQQMHQQQPQYEGNPMLQYGDSSGNGCNLHTISEAPAIGGAAPTDLSTSGIPELRPDINFYMKEGPYVCSVCGQGFNGQGNLKRHTKIVHEGIKDFSCRFCYRKFAKAQTLKHHEMTHTGEKPHECQYCGKRFIQIVALKRHLQTHTKLIGQPPAQNKDQIAAAVAAVDHLNKMNVEKEQQLRQPLQQNTIPHLNINTNSNSMCSSMSTAANAPPLHSPHQAISLNIPIPNIMHAAPSTNI